ncbi:MAG: acyl-CoA dehydrogenase family protein [Rhodospirillales bacterium]|nr:acyl-CoA dehydrogenase family protein [Rhodospirillales bacterium]
MDLRFTPDEIAFREEVRHFLRREIPADIRRRLSDGRHLSRQDMVTCHRILNARGWAVPHWPREWGGQDWSPVFLYILQEEIQRAAVPPPLPFNVNMVGPVIATFGNAAQQRRFLPATANIDIWWCQGFSEPGAGSDLAGLRTRAERDGDCYVVNGQKTWTTLAQHADWIFCLVRTNREAKKQEGISFLLIDMTTPGITVRPLITIDGAHEVNEVFFDDVRVPAENLVGEENKGWNYAKFLLSNERSGIARIGLSKERIARARRLARETPAGDGTLWDDADFRKRVALIEVQLKALEITQMRVVTNARNRASDKPDPNSSILKIKGSELQQATTELLKDIAGPYALPAEDGAEGSNEPPVGPEWAALTAPVYFNNRKVSIYGGSNEIQRNIIAKAFLGL